MKMMVTPEEALQIILGHVRPLGSETVPHGAALGRTLGLDVIAPLDLPPFDNSAMDGYAVLSADLAGTAEDNPVVLPCIETVGAGDVAQNRVLPGQCLKIMTGAPLPSGADAVVMREETREENFQIQFLVPAIPGQNIRLAGSDITRGEVVMTTGTVIGAAQWAMLASLGQAQVTVARRPRIGIIVTGAELVPIEAPLLPGQIRDSNSYALRALVESCGAVVQTVRFCGDTLEEFEKVLTEVAAASDIVISSGGVSAGDFDPVRDVLREKAEVFFWKIAMKPGKPVMFASLGETLIFGLPGNPVSVMVAFEEFTRPAILKMGGRTHLKRIEIPVRLTEGFRTVEGRVEYVRAQVHLEDGAWRAVTEEDQGSGRLSTLTRANALLVVPAAQTQARAGDTLTARLIDCPEID